MITTKTREMLDLQNYSNPFKFDRLRAQNTLYCIEPCLLMMIVCCPLLTVFWLLLLLNFCLNHIFPNLLLVILSRHFFDLMMTITNKDPWLTTVNIPK